MAPKPIIARLTYPHKDLNEDYRMAKLMMLFLLIAVLALQSCTQGARQNYLAPDLNHVLTNGKVASIHSGYSAKRVYHKLQRYFSVVDRQYAVRDMVVSREPYGFQYGFAVVNAMHPDIFYEYIGIKDAADGPSRTEIRVYEVKFRLGSRARDLEKWLSADNAEAGDSGHAPGETAGNNAARDGESARSAHTMRRCRRYA